MQWRVSIVAGMLVAALGSPLAARPAVTVAHAPASAGSLADEATMHEKAGQWLGAVSAWRDYARIVEGDNAEFARALNKLHDLAGVSWLTSLQDGATQPLLVGRDVILVSSRESAGPGTRSVVNAVDRASGRALWRREDAVAVPLGDDVAVFVQNHQHLVRVDPHSGSDMWQAHMAGAGPHRLVGVRDGLVFAHTDGWPAAFDLKSGEPRWSAADRSRPGSRAELTEVGVLVWPGPQHPNDLGDAAMALLRCDNGKVVWRRPMVAGEPWQVALDHENIYVADPHLQSAAAWTAIAQADGRTLWRQRQLVARPSTLSRMGEVLIERYADDPLSHTVRFLDPHSGAEVWQSDKVANILWNGPVLESGPASSLCARDLNTGKVWWSMPQTDELQADAADAVLGLSLFLPARGPGSLSGTDTPGALAADRRTGQIAWRHRSQDAPYQQDWRPLAADGDLLLLERHMSIAHPKLADHVAANQVSSLIALDAAHGDVAFGLWDVVSAPAAAPLRVGSTLYVVGQEKNGVTLYAIDVEKARALVKAGRRWWF